MQSWVESGARMAIWWLINQNSKTIVKLNKCSSGLIRCWSNTCVLGLVQDEQEQVNVDSKHEGENNQHYYNIELKQEGEYDQQK